MISRKSATAIGDCYDKKFSGTKSSRSYNGRTTYATEVWNDHLYDFLFDNEHSAWFCNQSKRLSGHRSIKEWIMRLHTGETVTPATQDWTWKQRQQLGQEYLRNLAEDMLQWYRKEQEAWRKDKLHEPVATMQRQLEIDGYIFRDGKLLSPESDVLDTQEEAGILATLYKRLALGNEETAMHHLKLSEEHYVAGRWDDAIGNARKFFECALSEIAIAHSSRFKNAVLSDKDAERPVFVRDYLERESLLEAKEKEAIAKVYGLLSNTGGHPYMAQNDQARLLRHLALTLSQFVMLRFQGFSSQSQGQAVAT